MLKWDTLQNFRSNGLAQLALPLQLLHWCINALLKVASPWLVGFGSNLVYKGYWGGVQAFQIIWWLLACTSFTNMTDFLPIRQEFVFFTRGGRKVLRYPGSEIVHVRWSSNFEKCGGIIVKLSFGGCFTKHPVFGTRKMENGIRKWLNFYSTQLCNIWV